MGELARKVAAGRRNSAMAYKRSGLPLCITFGSSKGGELRAWLGSICKPVRSLRRVNVSVCVVHRRCDSKVCHVESVCVKLGPATGLGTASFCTSYQHCTSFLFVLLVHPDVAISVLA